MRIDRKLCFAALLIPLSAIGQTTAENATATTAPPTATIAGQITGLSDADRKAVVLVRAEPGERIVARTETNMDKQGRFSIDDLHPGSYSVHAILIRGERSKSVTLLGGEHTEINFAFSAAGTVSGKVLDRDRKPVQGIFVNLLARELDFGGLDWTPKGSVRTDSEGKFAIGGLEPGRDYYLYARTPDLKASSVLAADPLKRPPVLAPTWYPDSPGPATAAPIVVSDGGEFGNAIVTMTAVTPLCVSGTARINGRPAQQMIFVTDEVNADYDKMPREVKSGSDGSFRICALGRGQYRLMATRLPSGEVPAAYGEREFALSDHDLDSVAIDSSPGSPLPVEIGWWGAPPQDASGGHAEALVTLWPVHRYHFQGEDLNVRASIPRASSIPAVISGSYLALVYLSNQTLEYVKDVRYCDQSYLREPAPIATPRCALQVLIASDGGRVAVDISDDKGNPLPDRAVVIAPSPLSTQDEFIAAHQTGRTDGSGHYVSVPLAPGKYKVFSPAFPVDTSADCLSRLWREAAGVDDTEVTANSSAAVRIQAAP